jgi:hypothetical protein
VRDNAILPPTASGDGAGERFVSTDGVRRWRWGALLYVTGTFASTFRELKKTFFYPFFFWETLRTTLIGSHGRVGWELRRLYRFLSCHLFGPENHGQTWKGWERSGEKGLIISDNQAQT